MAGNSTIPWLIIDSPISHSRLLHETVAHINSQIHCCIENKYKQMAAFKETQNLTNQRSVSLITCLLTRGTL